MKTNIHFLSYLAVFYLEWEMFPTKFVEKIKTHILCPVFFLNRTVYEIIWNTIVERGRPQMAVWRMWIACSIPKTTNTHSEYTTHYFSTATMVARKRHNITLYVYCLSRYSCGDTANLLIREVRNHGKSGLSVPRMTTRHQDTHTHTHTSFPLMSRIYTYVGWYMKIY
jgi:hypothetical protein